MMRSFLSSSFFRSITCVARSPTVICAHLACSLASCEGDAGIGEVEEDGGSEVVDVFSWPDADSEGKRGEILDPVLARKLPVLEVRSRFFSWSSFKHTACPKIVNATAKFLSDFPSLRGFDLESLTTTSIGLSFCGSVLLPRNWSMQINYLVSYHNIYGLHYCRLQINTAAILHFPVFLKVGANLLSELGSHIL
jgi:hypothetical protein